MFGWPASNLAGAVARKCGATGEQADVVRFGTAAACFPVDPAGSVIGMVHATASSQAREGDKGAEFVDKTMSLASWVLAVPSPGDIGITKPDA